MQSILTLPHDEQSLMCIMFKVSLYTITQNQNISIFKIDSRMSLIVALLIIVKINNKKNKKITNENDKQKMLVNIFLSIHLILIRKVVIFLLDI